MSQCLSGYITDFQLRLQYPQGNGDDTATDNVRMICTSLNGSTEKLKGDGLDNIAKSEWREWRNCEPPRLVCGIQTQIEDEDCGRNFDCTALNNVRMSCCHP